VQGQVQQLDQTTQVVPSSDGSNGRILSLDQSLQSSNSPEGLARGSGYTPGTYTDVELSGGSGTGARGTVVVGGDGKVQTVTLTSNGHGYQASDSLTASSANLGGSGSGFEVEVSRVVSRGSPEGLGPGSNYTPGTYTDVPLTGGSGAGARGTVVVGEDGTVSSVSLTVFGKNYQSGESLSVSDAKLGGGGGSGFSVDVSNVDITPPSLDDVLRNVLPTLGN